MMGSKRRRVCLPICRAGSSALASAAQPHSALVSKLKQRKPVCLLGADARRDTSAPAFKDIYLLRTTTKAISYRLSGAFRLVERLKVY
jgi:hypothetical protein